ncbi:MAG: hypothetical protein WA667_13030 [Candidatus Nitrosopolaris sp.]
MVGIGVEFTPTDNGVVCNPGDNAITSIWMGESSSRTASVIRNFELYDPYRPYHPYIILDPTSVGKDCKGSKDGVI